MSRVLALLAALAPAAAFAGTGIGQEWRFRVLLDEREVGDHVFRVEERGGERRVASDAQFDVRFLFIDAYSYRHRARERWQGECLASIEAHTDDNGERLAVRGEREESRFTLSAGDGRVELPQCVMSFAYWNPAMLEQTRLLNAQTGELVPVRIEPQGEETLSVRGAEISARRYALLAPDFRIDLWYDRDEQWVRLESRTDGGRLLRYLIQ